MKNSRRYELNSGSPLVAQGYLDQARTKNTKNMLSSYTVNSSFIMKGLFDQASTRK